MLYTFVRSRPFDRASTRMTMKPVLIQFELVKRFNERIMVAQGPFFK